MGKAIALLFRMLAISVIVLPIGCGAPSSTYVLVEGEMLGTFMRVTARTELPASQIYTAMKSIDAEAKESMSIFEDNSLLSQLNDNRTDSVDEHITYCLELARQVHQHSEGAYDVTIAPLVEAYGFAGDERKSEINVDSLLSFVGMDKVSIQDGRLIKEDSRMRLDFNSIAKGYVVDLAARKLEQMGISDYLVDIGGEVRCRGLNSKGGEWRVGVETPFDGNNTVGAYLQQVITLSNCSMATSGNYRRYYLDEQGRKVAHTIDPKTGRSAVTELLSATVVASTCAEADAYGTMFMAMGLQSALRVARELQHSGVMVYFIAAGEGDDFEVYYSSNLRSALKSVDGFHPIE